MSPNPQSEKTQPDVRAQNPGKPFNPQGQENKPGQQPPQQKQFRPEEDSDDADDASSCASKDQGAKKSGGAQH
jgi:hypothetical protein